MLMVLMIIVVEFGLFIFGDFDEIFEYVSFIKEIMKRLIVFQVESEEKIDQVNVFWEYFIMLCQKSILKK